MSSTQQLLLTEGGGAIPNYIEDVFSTYLYDGSGASRSITNNIDLSTKGGLVWIKNRFNTGGTYTASHILYDTARGMTSGSSPRLITDTTDAQAAQSNYVISNTTGFDLGSSATGALVNATSNSYTSWTFRKQPKFFDVVTYTGNGIAGRTISHSLGSVPGCIIIKQTSSAGQDWPVYHRSLGPTYVSYLDLTQASSTSRGGFVWNNTAPTSTVFSVGIGGEVNSSGETYVAYLFAHDAGGFGLTGTDNVISCGSFTASAGTGTVTLGYEPQWVLLKRTDSAQDWYLVDVMRGQPVTTASGKYLSPNLSSAENTGGFIYPTATGFQLDPNAFGSGNNGTYIYIAIRRGPMKVPTDATKVFNPSVRASGTGAAVSTTGVGFPPDLLISSERTTGVLFTKGFHDRLRGNVILRSNTTNNEAADSTGVTAYGQDGFSFGTDGGFATVNYSGSNYVYEAFKRAPSFFDEVCYTGTGSARTVTHNLGAVPELMIVKSRSYAATNWDVYVSSGGGTKFMRLDGTLALTASSSIWNDTDPTSTVFTVGTHASVNQSAETYVAYLFATCAGVSKVGNYTGTGTLTTINCGFAGGARFVLIKRTDSTSNWFVWDTARGMVSGTDPSLSLNTTAAESNANSVYTATTGFQLLASPSADVNTNGGSYIFLAVA